MKQADKLVKYRVDDLIPWDRNPRHISPENLDRLAAGIGEFGLVQPIIVNVRTGRVVGGHQRLEVLRRDGVEETFVVEVDLSEDKEAALNVALNNPRLAGEYDDAVLASILQDLDASDEASLGDSGFDREDLEELLERLGGELPDEEPVDESELGPDDLVGVTFAVTVREREFVEDVIGKVDRSKRGAALVRLCELHAAEVSDIVFEPTQEDRDAIAEIDVSQIEMRELNFTIGRRIVESYHYTHKWAASTKLCLGFFVDKVLVGVLCYGTGASPYLLTAAFDDISRSEGWELVRAFAFDWGPKNVESHMLGASFRYIRSEHPDIHVLVSFADPGQGHMGTIYQATNWLYTGTSAGQYYLKDEKTGELIHSRTYNRYELEERKRLLSNEENLVWQEGRHRYIYLLGSKKEKKSLRDRMKYDVLPYPKAGDGPVREHIVSVDPVEAIVADVVSVLSQDLLKPEYREKFGPNNRDNPTYGHCYVATEAVFYLLGDELGDLKPYHGRDELGVVHWWLEEGVESGSLPGGHRRVDPTSQQYTSQDRVPPYDVGVRGTFLTKKPSKRARVVIDRVRKLQGGD